MLQNVENVEMWRHLCVAADDEDGGAPYDECMACQGRKGGGRGGLSPRLYRSPTPDCLHWCRRNPQLPPCQRFQIQGPDVSQVPPPCSLISLSQLQCSSSMRGGQYGV